MTNLNDGWRCARCGSPDWVRVSRDEGWTITRQCIPCGWYSNDLAESLPGPAVITPTAAIEVRLTFAELQLKSRTRRDRWHNADSEPWSGADWSNAMCGEAGEAANVVKKLRRHETGMTDKIPVSELVTMLADELGDVVAYAVLVAEHYGLDLAECVARKFNAVSAREGFPERLPGDG